MQQIIVLLKRYLMGIFFVNKLKKLSLQKFWFPLIWNEKGIGRKSQTVPATVNRIQDFYDKPL